MKWGIAFLVVDVVVGLALLAGAAWHASNANWRLAVPVAMIGAMCWFAAAQTWRYRIEFPRTVVIPGSAGEWVLMVHISALLGAIFGLLALVFRDSYGWGVLLWMLWAAGLSYRKFRSAEAARRAKRHARRSIRLGGEAV